jgi:hypothetical protein
MHLERDVVGEIPQVRGEVFDMAQALGGGRLHVLTAVLNARGSEVGVFAHWIRLMLVIAIAMMLVMACLSLVLFVPFLAFVFVFVPLFSLVFFLVAFISLCDGIVPVAVVRGEGIHRESQRNGRGTDESRHVYSL